MLRTREAKYEASFVVNSDCICRHLACIRFLAGLSTIGQSNALGIVDGLIPSMDVEEAGRIGDAGSDNDTLITALANVLPGIDIVLNAQGGFFYESTTASANGTKYDFSSNSQSGQLFTLLHELAHVNQTSGFIKNDADPQDNAKNEDSVWQHCSKIITGN